MGAFWLPTWTQDGERWLTLRLATLGEVALFERWDREPHVIAATSDDPDAGQAFEDAVWRDELAAPSPESFYLVAEVCEDAGAIKEQAPGDFSAGLKARLRPIGAMQIIDPALESTHYWGDIEPNLRALDIWIGERADLGRGFGSMMMYNAVTQCFDQPEVAAIVIDPLASNVRAHRFYQRLGFRPVGRRLFNGEDDCLVHRLDRKAWSFINRKEG